MNKSVIKAWSWKREPYRLETGFSMLEAVVVVGVLLALAVGGFFAYGPITENAKRAAVKSAASSVHTATLVASIDGDSNTKPQDVIDNWNASTNKIRVEILETEAGESSENGDFCISATNVESPHITVQEGTCTTIPGGPGGSGSIITPTPDPLPSVSTASLKFGLANDNAVSGTETDATSRLVNESPSMISYYMDWTNSVNPATLTTISDKGATPVITWEPWVATDGVNQPTYKLSTITAGNHDTYIRSWASSLKTYNKPVMLRFAHEMNGNWYPWSEQVNGNAPGDYVAAWRHVVDLFRAEGATNVQWIWAPNVQQDGISTAALYPGSSYVDHTGVDGFNWGSSRPWTGADGWQNPWDVLDSSLVEIAGIAPDKGMIVTEIGTVESENGHSKAQWITDMIYYLNHWSDSHPGQVTGFIWFDLNKEKDWRIASSTASSDAMKSALASR